MMMNSFSLNNRTGNISNSDFYYDCSFMGSMSMKEKTRALTSSAPLPDDATNDHGPAAVSSKSTNFLGSFNLPRFDSSKPGIINSGKYVTTKLVNNNGNGNSSNNNNKINRSQNNVTIHYLWESGVWTTRSQEQANYFHSKSFVKPRIAVIEPNTLENINSLSYKYGFGNNNNNNSAARTNRDRRRLGSFKDYVFFSNRATSVFQRRLGEYASQIEFQSLYQFEARYFQYSILRGNVRFVKNYRNSNEYLIFKFGRAAQSFTCNKQQQNAGSNNNNNTNNVTYTPLYGICEVNDRHPERQPWCCQHIVTLDEMLQFFGLSNNNNDDDVNNNNRSNGNDKTRSEFLQHIKINHNFVSKRFNPTFGTHSNKNKITRMLKHGLCEYHKGMQQRASSINMYHQQRNHNRNYNNNNNNNNGFNRNPRRKCKKLKNEDKFSYLQHIAENMGVNWRTLINIIGDCIDNAFEFARKYPNTVLTQVYMDEESGNINYELVLLGEIYDKMKNQYYKVAIPIVEYANAETSEKYYLAKNVLTPKMAKDNIRLNSVNGCLKTNNNNNKSWIADMDNFNVSFYNSVDSFWYDNIASAIGVNINPGARARKMVNKMRPQLRVVIINNTGSNPHHHNSSNNTSNTTATTATTANNNNNNNNKVNNGTTSPSTTPSSGLPIKLTLQHSRSTTDRNCNDIDSDNLSSLGSTYGSIYDVTRLIYDSSDGCGSDDNKGNVFKFNNYSNGTVSRNKQH